MTRDAFLSGAGVVVRRREQPMVWLEVTERVQSGKAV
jgi:hypothetical protein